MSYDFKGQAELQRYKQSRYKFAVPTSVETHLAQEFEAYADFYVAFESLTDGYKASKVRLYARVWTQPKQFIELGTLAEQLPANRALILLWLKAYLSQIVAEVA
jgi:hypothetical protein